LIFENKYELCRNHNLKFADWIDVLKEQKKKKKKGWLQGINQKE